MKIFDELWVRVAKCVLYAPFVVVLVLASCGTSKKAQRLEIQKEVQKDVEKKANVTGVRETNEVSQENEEKEVTETIIEYSEPDSIGKQYPTKRTERKTIIKNGKEVDKTVTEELSGEKVMKDKTEEKTALKSKGEKDVRAGTNTNYIYIVIGLFLFILIASKLKKVVK